MSSTTTVQQVIILKKPIELQINKARLLSLTEVNTMLSQEERKYLNTWWLDEPGPLDDGEVSVYSNGRINTEGSFVDCGARVRPVLEISLKNSFLKIGDIFLFDNKEFKIISESLAWIYNGDIGTAPFSEPISESDRSRMRSNANIYNSSTIKSYIESWFNNALNK